MPRVCPACKSTRVVIVPAPSGPLPTDYGACRACGTIWEAYPPGAQAPACSWSRRIAMPDGSDLPAATKRLLVADLFCGAGGSSTGARRALAARGYRMDLVAVNHWDVAIETHSRNHPEARHYLRDLMSADPIALVPEGKLDLLMASPTCTHHSRARGGKPSSDQQRMDPWAIIRWCSELRVKRLLVENVPEFVDWGPIDLRTGRPIKSRRGEYFRAWVGAIKALGGRFDHRIVNCADYGDATTRIRFFGQARFDSKPIRWPAPTHSRAGGDLFGTEKWRAAREIIDWNLRGQSIFGRKKGLAPKTLDRIIAGAVKFNWPAPLIEATRAELRRQLQATIARTDTTLKTAKTQKQRKAAIRARDWCEARLRRLDAEAPVAAAATNPQPTLVTLRQHDAGRGLDEPIPALCASGRHVDMAEPFILSPHTSGAPRATAEPLPTITTGGAGNGDHPGCARPAMVEGFILNRHGENGSVRAHAVDDPVPTCDCRGAGYLVEPFVFPANQSLDRARGLRSVDDPLCTITATGTDLAVVEPFIAAVAHGNSEGEANPDARRTRSVDEPLQTIHAGGNTFALVEPFVLSQASGGTPRGVSDPVPSIPCGGAHALICPYYGSGSGETCASVDAPLPTCTAKARFGFVMPVTHNGDSGRARSLDEPPPTVTTAHRGEIACIVAAFGERDGQAPRVHSVDQPVPVICARGRIQLAEGFVVGRNVDVLFRMLDPRRELARAMSFSDAEAEYVFAGTKTDITKQIGNAVPVRTATALVGALVDG